jgi:hypothetical protein
MKLRIIHAPVLLALSATCAMAGVKLTDEQAREIGQRIWKNECAGTVSGLTTWNIGEAFPSLGIAHFIWYPKGVRGPFQESFPGLVNYLESQRVQVPAWLNGPAPWNTRSEFQSDLDSPRMKTLRALLQNTIPEQARYAAMRLENALPKMLAAAPASQREKIKKNFNRVAGQRLGLYALMDYVNFKGEGTSPSERYKGRGWGLLQVLETMPASGPPLPEFAAAADKVLTERVKNSPPSRNEAKWLTGWRNRLATYTR